MYSISPTEGYRFYSHNIRSYVVWAAGDTSHKTAHSLVFRTSNSTLDNARTVLGCWVATYNMYLYNTYIIHIIDSDPPTHGVATKLERRGRIHGKTDPA